VFVIIFYQLTLFTGNSEQYLGFYCYSYLRLDSVIVRYCLLGSMGRNYRKQKAKQRYRMQVARMNEACSPVASLVVNSCHSRGEERNDVPQLNQLALAEQALI